MKRSRFEIIIDILNASMERANKTKIVYDARLNFKQAEEYINFLIEADLLTKEIEGNRKTYKTTEKGKEMVSKFKELTDNADL
ncbi:MAG: DUF4364 family protein [Archaeoglobaceae archaeon]